MSILCTLVKDGNRLAILSGYDAATCTNSNVVKLVVVEAADVDSAVGFGNGRDIVSKNTAIGASINKSTRLVSASSSVPFRDIVRVMHISVVG